MVLERGVSKLLCY